jgi:hypothetical protein
MNGRGPAVATGAVLAGLGAAAVGYAGYRRWQQRWGATDDEVARALPGDELVPRPQFTATNVVEIRATPAQVWPWLVQMGGYSRAGWYSYDRFDNGGRPSADRIVPELQHLQVGDVLPTNAEGQGFRVVSIDPGRSLVMEIREGNGTISSAFVLDDVGGGRTRLINRVRWHLERRPSLAPFALMMDVGHFVMERRMLLNIRDRAERLAAGAEPIRT